MKNEIFELYNRCFPDYQTTKEWFYNLLKLEKAHIILVHDDTDKIIGFSMIHENSITLLCVDKAYRTKGYGTKLLNKSEEFINGNGAKRIILGRGNYYILQGVPIDVNNYAVYFFKKRGYSAKWESTNMYLSLEKFNKDTLTILSKLETLNFRFVDYSDEVDKNALLEAVKDAESNWVNIFETCTDPVMLAILNNKIVGFQILSLNGGRFLPNENIGCIGCVGVINEARKKGIGLCMVAEGADWLKRNGCLAIELRYVELVDWYKKIGFYITGKQWMGEKNL